MDDLVERNNLYYKKFTDAPFTGDVSGIWNGKIKKGKITGEWLSYYESGQLKLKINYKEGKMDGVWEYFDEEGFLLVTKTYIKGIEQE